MKSRLRGCCWLSRYSVRISRIGPQAIPIEFVRILGDYSLRNESVTFQARLNGRRVNARRSGELVDQIAE